MEDFVPEDGLDRNFLDDTAPTKDEKKTEMKVLQDSDSDMETPGGNPMVAGFQDDVDVEDKPPDRPLLPMDPVPGNSITLSSEEEAEEVARHPLTPVLPPQKSSELETKRFPTKASKPPKDTAPRATEPPTKGSSQGHKEKKTEPAVSSDSDPEGPIAAQMLSFVMDDPDFESDSDTQQKVGEFPVREDPSDVSDEDTSPAQLPLPAKPAVPTFKLKNDSDLFGLGLEAGPKESSEEDKEDQPPRKEEKKKKKKKGREEEEKASKKKSKHKKSKDKEESKEEKRRRPRTKEKRAVDELEAFLGGGAPSGHLRGGGDYEEL